MREKDELLIFRFESLRKIDHGVAGTFPGQEDACFGSSHGIDGRFQVADAWMSPSGIGKNSESLRRDICR